MADGVLAHTHEGTRVPSSSVYYSLASKGTHGQDLRMAVRVLALFERHLSALACSGGIRKASLLATHQKTMWTGSAHAREGTRALRAPLLRARLLRGDPHPRERTHHHEVSHSNPHARERPLSS